VWVQCYVFLVGKLADTCCYLCAKKYRLCLVERCDLLSFCTAKEEREKARGGAHMPRCTRERVRSARGPGASALRGADGGGVSARAVAGYRVERASKRDK